jgi:hypothetical protein
LHCVIFMNEGLSRILQFVGCACQCIAAIWHKFVCLLRFLLIKSCKLKYNTRFTDLGKFFGLNKCESGGIGIRTGFRFQRRKT